MALAGLDLQVADGGAYQRAVERFRAAGIVLPTFAQLAEPHTIPARLTGALAGVTADEAHPLNLFRTHWYNDPSRAGQAPVPVSVTLPESFTGVAAPIVVLLGDLFPMIRSHKVLAAYGCLVPRILTGRFDPTWHSAVWPSTGNYCRGGVAISRLMGCRGVAVLPQGMSRERFAWLEGWVGNQDDIVRTPGTESNVKEIYDECARLAGDPRNVIFNQFAEFGNHLVHYSCTGRALEAAFEALRARHGSALRLAAFVSASGSAGTLGAGDYLRSRHGTRVVAVEPLECPTMLANGFGEHNIQGIGDKHIPLIHNVMNTDLVTAVSDRATDRLSLLFGAEAGLRYLRDRRRVPDGVLAALPSFGLSSICNVIAAVKTARYLGLGPEDVVVTVATDGAGLYASERERTAARDFPDGFDAVDAAEAFGRYMLGAGAEHLVELTRPDKERIFNLGYYTWVEQRGVTAADFAARRDQRFWTGLLDLLPAWDAMIGEFNDRAAG